VTAVVDTADYSSGMSIPAIPGDASERHGAGRPARRPEWSSLTGDEKRERLLAAATAVFSRQGLEAPMSEVAEAVGAGVASIYRLYPSKYELYAALVVRRMDQVVDAARAAESLPGDRWAGLTQMLRDLVAEQAVEPFVGEARALVSDHPDVIDAVARAADAQERVLAAARAEGRLRADATSLDLRLLFAATRAAKRVEPEQWPRMLELMLDALDSSRGR
jgi:AcrR family transcriptional regulator